MSWAGLLDRGYNFSKRTQLSILLFTIRQISVCRQGLSRWLVLETAGEGKLLADLQISNGRLCHRKLVVVLRGWLGA